MTDFDTAAMIASRGSGVVDYLGNFNRGAKLAQDTTNIYDMMSAKQALKRANESGDPYQLGAAIRSAQIQAPEYAQSVSGAQGAQAITLGRQNAALADDRSQVAMQALQAPPQQRIQLLAQEATELARNGFDPTPVKNLIDLTMQGQHDLVTQQLQAHIAAAQGQQDMPMDVVKYQFGEQLRKTDPEAYKRFLASTGISIDGTSDKTKKMTEGLPQGYIWNDPTDPTQGVSRIKGITPTQADNPLIKGAPSGYMWNDPNDPTQGVTKIKGTIEKDSVPTEGERKSAVLLKRMEGSLAQLQAALNPTAGGDQKADKPQLLPSALREIGLESAANAITPENRQRVDNAQLDILDAALTLGTGAAYTREQLEGYRKSFFAQIGDDPKTVQDKKARLNNVIEAARIAAGRANTESDQGAAEDDVNAIDETDPQFKAWADKYFGGDIQKAKKYHEAHP